MCTGIRFNDNGNNLYWGRNLDWYEGYGQRPLVMPKGFKLDLKCEHAINTEYASVGMGISYEGFPLYFNAGNEAGLAVGGLNFPGYAKYEGKPVEGRLNICAFEIQAWIAGSFASVDEVEDAIRELAIIGEAPSANLGVAMLHWMVADAKRSIVLEYQEDGLHVYDDTVDVLTNQPPFGWHMENLRNYMCCGNEWPGEVVWNRDEMTPFGSGSTMRGIPGDVYSTSRFVKAAFVNSHYPQKDSEAENVMRMFHSLGSVSFSEGMAKVENGQFEITLFSDCFSQKTGNYYFNTYDNPALRYVCLKDFDGAAPDAIIEPDAKALASF